jgi:4-amino-4-deoxy-L-arabinose transferase-like glycosyltransferase
VSDEKKSDDVAESEKDDSERETDRRDSDPYRDSDPGESAAADAPREGSVGAQPRQRDAVGGPSAQRSVDGAGSAPREHSDSGSEDSDSAIASDSDSDAATPESESPPPPRTLTPLPPDPRPAGRYRLRGGLILGASLIVTFLMMASSSQLPRGPIWGFLTLLVGAFGLLDMLGLLTMPADDATPIRATAFGRKDGEPIWAAPQYTVVASLVALFGGAAVFGWDGLPYVLTAAFLCLAPSALSRPALAVFVIIGLIYVPLAGTFSLWDPWETHYGEVAREILARDDWISLWWCQENWFWSKPILIFWSDALSMASLGIDYQPDSQMFHSEWALRLPIITMAMVALLTAYFAVSKSFGKRAGLLSALVLGTMPQFFFLAHQAITDMPLVSNMTTAVCLLILAITEDPNREVRLYRVGRLVLSARHAVIVLLFMIIAPQALYLASRNVSFTDQWQFAWHGDQFMYGSAGNSHVPGNAPARDVLPFVADMPLVPGLILLGVILVAAFGLVWWLKGRKPALITLGAGISAIALFVGVVRASTGSYDLPLLEPMAQGLVWGSGLAWLIYQVRKERRARGLFMFAFYVFCGIAFMGKGIPGFALPGMIALFYLIASKRWYLLFDGHLRIAVGALTVMITGLSWFVAMFIRHGPPFTDRLLIHDHVNRLAAGVHGDTGTIRYFIEQLGFGMFPWVALVPAALTLFVWNRYASAPSPIDPGGGPYRGTGPISPASLDADRQKQVLIVLAVWFAAAFTLFSAMITKFHHYIFPVVPSAGIATGILLDKLFGKSAPTGRKSLLAWALLLVGPAAALLGIASMWGDPRGVVPLGVEQADRAEWVTNHAWNPATSWALVALGAAALAGAFYLFRQSSKNDARTPVAHAPLAALLTAGAILIAFVARDLSWITDARPHGFERLIHLFVYNYTRPWPDHFDYRPAYTAFGLVMSLLVAASIFVRFRAVATRALLVTALFFSTWVLDVYMVDLSPHWGMRELIYSYYDARESPDEHLLAWQMNWKGENYYTANRVYVFVDLDNRKVREYIDEHVGERTFFVLEHTRLGSFRGVMGSREIREVTDKRLCNKFIVVEVTL